MRNTKKQEGIEVRVKKRAKRNQMRNIVLASAYLAVLAGMMIMTPNAVRLLRHVEKRIGPSPKLKRRISQTYSELIGKGILERDGFKIILTDKGMTLAAEIALKEQLLTTPKRWDGKWRIIMFDVWERRRPTRDELRRTLEKSEFIKIQNSVWAYPYPCEELLVFLRTRLKLGRGILYMVVEEIEHDEELRRHFKLPLE